MGVFTSKRISRRGSLQPATRSSTSEPTRTAAADYPDYVIPAARAVAAGEVDRGVVLCGSGAGAAITADKVFGVRSTTVHDVYTAHQAVEHDGLNVIALGARVIGSELAWEIVKAFIGAEFTGEERHVRRVGKIDELDQSRS